MHPTFVVMGGGQKQMKTKQKVNGDKTNKTRGGGGGARGTK
jgi:hypothetical protein